MSKGSPHLWRRDLIRVKPRRNGGFIDAQGSTDRSRTGSGPWCMAQPMDHLAPIRSDLYAPQVGTPRLRRRIEEAPSISKLSRTERDAGCMFDVQVEALT
jgi:hypothetical protein